jgi:hypothetical protein
MGRGREDKGSRLGEGEVGVFYPEEGKASRVYPRRYYHRLGFGGGEKVLIAGVTEEGQLAWLCFRKPS